MKRAIQPRYCSTKNTIYNLLQMAATGIEQPYIFADIRFQNGIKNTILQKVYINVLGLEHRKDNSNF